MPWKQSFRITLREFKRFKGTIKGVHFPPTLTSGHSLPSAPRVSGFIADSSSYRGDACRGQAHRKHFVQQFEIKNQGKVRLENDPLCVVTAVKMLFISLPVWGHGANEDLPFLVVAAVVLGQPSACYETAAGLERATGTARPRTASSRGSRQQPEQPKGSSHQGGGAGQGKQGGAENTTSFLVPLGSPQWRCLRQPWGVWLQRTGWIGALLLWNRLRWSWGLCSLKHEAIKACMWSESAGFCLKRHQQYS